MTFWLLSETVLVEMVSCQGETEGIPSSPSSIPILKDAIENILSENAYLGGRCGSILICYPKFNFPLFLMYNHT